MLAAITATSDYQSDSDLLTFSALDGEDFLHDCTDLDIDNLIEEIDSIGRRDKREIYSRLKVLLIHLLKWKYQPQKCTPSWVNTINK